MTQSALLTQAPRDSRIAVSHGRLSICGSVLLAALTSFAVGLADGQASPSAAQTGAPVDETAVVGMIGNRRVTEGEVIAQAKDQFQQGQDELDREVRQLQVNYEQARHDMLQQQLDKLLDRRALEMAAKARHLSPDAVLANAKVPLVTDAEVRAFYDANRARTTLTFEQLAPRIRAYLASEHNETAMRRFYDGLRAKYGIHSELAPFREDVAATGPVRGNPHAPVTIVEFGDFQCPYCKQAEPTLRAILTKYRNDVRLVFRELPLTQLHPNAMTAAEAGVCADRQGKFWPMHDRMYADQNALDIDGLKATAKRLGLNADRFAACMSDTATARQIETDMQAAGALGIGGTPYFFVNGRPLNGSVPPEKFDTVISEELGRLGIRLAGGPATRAPQS